MLFRSQKDRVEEVEARLAGGEDVNTVFLMNRTALHCAVAKCNTKMVEIILKHNVDLKVRLWLTSPSFNIVVIV